MGPFRLRWVLPVAMLLICGCYNPYPHHGWHGQPGSYYQTQPGQMQSPGQLYIPPSDAPLAEPGGTSTYDDGEDADDFELDGGGSFYEQDGGAGGVPDPRDRSGTQPFDEDFGGSGGF